LHAVIYATCIPIDVTIGHAEDFARVTISDDGCWLLSYYRSSPVPRSGSILRRRVS
jgi:hypothetical protein